jgi:uncharacterized protein YjbI with pentapeptide repeats
MKVEEDMIHENKVFDKLIYQEKVVKGRKFVDCTFKSCKMNMTSFNDCSFTDCVFDDCDLSLMKVRNSSFSRVEVKRCKAIGIHWFEARDPFSIRFVDSIISYSSFYGQAIKKAVIKNCVAKETDFTGTNLVAADLTDTDLDGAKFADTDLSGADLRGARNYSIDLHHNKIKKAKFALPEAVSLLHSFDIIIE